MNAWDVLQKELEWLHEKLEKSSGGMAAWALDQIALIHAVLRAESMKARITAQSAAEHAVNEIDQESLR